MHRGFAAPTLGLGGVNRRYHRQTATESTEDRSGLPGVEPSDHFTPAELRLATRNHGLPLEALSYDVTPVGLHYLLVHYDIPVVDPSDWRLSVGGRVRRELSLSLEDIRQFPAETVAITMECAGNGRAGLSPRPVSQPWLLEAVGTAEWTGIPLRGLLEEAGANRQSAEVLFGGLDRGLEGGEQQNYERSLPLELALSEDVLLAFEMNGQPLPPQHGFPLRLVVPGHYGMASVKWLDRITVIENRFEGYQQARSYRLRQSPEENGVPVSRMLPRSLMVPPGIPDFATRVRHLRHGPVNVRGRAWSGYGPVERVEVSSDGGASWSGARLAPQTSRWAWQAWEMEWDAQEPGVFELCCRATDSAANVQPLEALWNLGGYSNNEVQRVPIVVEGA